MGKGADEAHRWFSEVCCSVVQTGEDEANRVKHGLSNLCTPAVYGQGRAGMQLISKQRACTSRNDDAHEFAPTKAPEMKLG